MLVLSRKLGQSIEIGTARVTVLNIRGDRVRIGVEADADTVILRSELAERQSLQVDPPRETV